MSVAMLISLAACQKSPENIVISHHTHLTEIVADNGSDCRAMGKQLVEYLDANEDSLTFNITVVANADEKVQEKYLDAYDIYHFNLTTLESCKSDENVQQVAKRMAAIKSVAHFEEMAGIIKRNITYCRGMGEKLNSYLKRFEGDIITDVTAVFLYDSSEQFNKMLSERDLTPDLSIPDAMICSKDIEEFTKRLGIIMAKAAGSILLKGLGM